MLRETWKYREGETKREEEEIYRVRDRGGERGRQGKEWEIKSRW